MGFVMIALLCFSRSLPPCFFNTGSVWRHHCLHRYSDTWVTFSSTTIANVISRAWDLTVYTVYPSMLTFHTQLDCRYLERSLYPPIYWSTSLLIGVGSEVSLARFLALPFAGYAILEKSFNFSGSSLSPLCGCRDSCATYLEGLWALNSIMHV